MDGQIAPGTVATVILLASLSGATTLLGIGAALRFSARPGAIAAGLGFSTGIMLVLSVFELLPEAVETGGTLRTSLGVVLGVGVLGLVGLAMDVSGVCGSSDPAAGPNLRVSYLVSVGLILHDVPEGFAMANAYLAAPASGLLFAVAIAIHKVPEEFAMALPAAVGASRRFLYGAGVVSALAEPLGAAIGLAGVGAWPGLLPVFLAFAAGAMVYVSLTQLVPLIRRMGRPSLAAAGVASSVAVYVALAALLRALER